MNNSAIIRMLMDRPVAYHPDLAHILGGVKCAVFMSQMLYWTGKGKRPDGYIWKTQAELKEETGLSRYEQEGARRKLRELGVLLEKRTGIPAKMHYKVDITALENLIEGYYRNQECRKVTDLVAENKQSIPETTAETTAETTIIAPDGAADVCPDCGKPLATSEETPKLADVCACRGEAVLDAAFPDDGRAEPPEQEGPPTSPGVEEFLRLFDAKRLNTGQRESLLELERQYPDAFLDCARWAADKGISRANAIASMRTALPEWGKQRKTKRGGNSRDQPGDEPAGFAGLRAWAKQKGIEVS